MAIYRQVSGVVPVAALDHVEPGLQLVSDQDPRHEGMWHKLLRHGVRPLLLVGDAIACLAAGVITQTLNPIGLTISVLLLLLLSHEGLYRSRLSLSVLDDLPRIFGRWLIALAVVVVATQLIGTRPSGLRFGAVVLAALIIIRSLNYAAVRFLRAHRNVSHPTMILGAGRTGREIAERLDHHPESGLRLVGFLDSRPRAADGLSAPMLGGPEDLANLLATHHPRALIVAHGMVPENELVALVRAAHRHRCEVFVVPRLYEVQHVGDDMDFIGDMPLVRLRRAAYRSLEWRLKRLIDIVFAAVAIAVLSPVLAAVALAVHVEGGRGVIFRQERVGCDGRRFDLMKFRSMRPVNETESQTNWNISHDDRLGPVGRFLRKSSIDELPQLFNILRGEMSLVGPRPERPHFVEQFDRLYRGYSARHRVPCGLTGWAQIHGLRGDTSIDERARFDNFYIENWSLWLDVKILLRTAISVVTEPGS